MMSHALEEFVDGEPAVGATIPRQRRLAVGRIGHDDVDHACEGGHEIERVAVVERHRLVLVGDPVTERDQRMAHVQHPFRRGWPLSCRWRSA